MAATLEGVFVLIDRASDTLDRIERRAERTDRALRGAGDSMDRIGTPRQVRNMERTERQLQNTDRATQMLDRDMGRSERSTRLLESRLVGLGARLAAVGRIITVLKFPAMVAGAGLAAQGLGALGGGAVAAISPLTDLIGVAAAVPAPLLGIVGAAVTTKFALGDVTEALGGNQQALKRLTPVGREFVDTLKQYKPVVTDLRETAQRGLFPGLTTALDRLQVARPMANRLLGRFGRSVGGQAARVATSFTRPAVLGDIDTLGRQGDRIFNRMSRGAINLAHAVLQISVAARPFTEWLSRTVLGWTRSARAAARLGRESGSLSRYFERTRDRLSQVFDIAGNLWGTMRGVLRAARPLGDALWGSFDRTTQRWEDFTNSRRGQRRMRQWFGAIRPPLMEFFGLIGDVATAWAGLVEEGGGERGGLTRTLRSLRDSVQPLAELLGGASEALGPGLADGLGEVIRLLNNLPWEPISILLTLATDFLGIVNDLIERFPILGYAISTLLTLATINKFTGFFDILQKGWRGAMSAFGRYQSRVRGTLTPATVIDPLRGPQAPIGGQTGSFIDPVRGPQAQAQGRRAGGSWFSGFRQSIARGRANMRETLGRITGGPARAAGGTGGMTWIGGFGDRLNASGRRGGRLGTIFRGAGAIGGGLMSAAFIAQFLPDITKSIGEMFFGRDFAKSKAGTDILDESREFQRRGILGYLKDSLSGHELGGGVREGGATRNRGDVQSIWAQLGLPMRARGGGQRGREFVPDIGRAMKQAMPLKPLEDLRKQQDRTARGTRDMRRSVVNDLADMRDRGTDRIQRLRRNMKTETDNMNQITNRGFESIVSQMQRHLRRISPDAFGGGTGGPGHTGGGHPSTAAMARGGRIRRAAGGMRIPGRGLHDTVMVAPGNLAAPGELIVNRHTERDHDRDARAAGLPTLAQRVTRETRRHSDPLRGGREFNAALGGRLRHFATGGRSVRDLVRLGRWMRSLGYTVGENAALGDPPLPGVHSATGWHYRFGGSGAIDVNADTMPGGEMAALDRLAGILRSRGWHILWRVADHFDHLHVDLANGIGALGGLAGLGPAPKIKLPDAFRDGRGLVGQASEGALRRVRRAAQRRLDREWGAGDLSGFSGGGSAAANRALGRRMARAFGWVGPQWRALDVLWTGESGWINQMNQAGSGATGIPQALPGSKMASEGADWATNPATQIAWGLKYIKSVYGSPVGALAAWQSRSPHWYERGGRMPQDLMPDMTHAYGGRTPQELTLRAAQPGGLPPDAASAALPPAARRADFAGWFGDGGSIVARRPTVLGVGERGQPERVTVEPANAPRAARRGGGPLVGHITVHNQREGDVRNTVVREVRQALHSLRRELEEAGVEDGDLL